MYRTPTGPMWASRRPEELHAYPPPHSESVLHFLSKYHGPASKTTLKFSLSNIHDFPLVSSMITVSPERRNLFVIRSPVTSISFRSASSRVG